MDFTEIIGMIATLISLGEYGMKGYLYLKDKWIFRSIEEREYAAIDPVVCGAIDSFKTTMNGKYGDVLLSDSDIDEIVNLYWKNNHKHGITYEDKKVTNEFICTLLNDYNEYILSKMSTGEKVLHAEMEKGFNQLSDEIKSQNAQPKSVKKICCEDIKKAGRKWYDQTKTEGSRFSKLIPNKEIFPLVGSFPIYVHKNETNEQTLATAINKSTEHLYLIGEGGIGKTTALFSIMKAAYDTGDSELSVEQIPLYIELSRANSAKDFNDGSSHFIINTILGQLRDSLGDVDNLKEQTIGLLTNRKGEQPEIVLLLDGLNEVSREDHDGLSVVGILSREIRYIIKNYRNVRVLLTSRTEEELFEDKSSILYLSGIKPETIEKFLSNVGFTENRIEKVKKNDQLMKLLRIPLFLTLYAEIKEEGDLLTRGEILDAFFVQKRKDLYSERNRAEMINKDLENENAAISGITPSMLAFMLDFILPEIAWHMVLHEEFQFSQGEIKTLVEHILTDVSDVDFCGEFGKGCFKEYRLSARENTRTIANSIVRSFEKGDDDKWSNITARVCECLNMQLGVITTFDYERYEVVHHHIRDYFAALYHINMLKLSVYIYEHEDNGDLARRCLLELSEDPLPSQILSFIGEALGETHNIPRYDEEDDKWIYMVPNPREKRSNRNLLKRCLAVYRHRFDGSDGYAVWNLFQILKLVRKDLSGEDFSHLDLSKCRANGYRLGNKSFSAILEGSKVTDIFFITSGHTDAVSSVQYSPDGKTIVTTSRDGTAKVWDSKTFEELGTLSGHADEVLSASYSPDGNRIITTSVDRTAIIWDANTFERIDPFVIHVDSVRAAEFSFDGKKILISSVDVGIVVWNTEKNETISTIKFSSASSSKLRQKMSGRESFYFSYNIFSSAHFSPDGSLVLAAGQDETARLYDVYTGNPVGEFKGDIDKKSDKKQEREFRGHKDVVFSAQFSPDGKTIVTASADGRAAIWDISTYKPIGVLNSQGFEVDTAQYSPDGSIIATGLDDGSIQIWNARTFEFIRTIKGHSAAICSVQFSPNGRFIASSSVDGSAKVWDAKSYEEVPGGVFSGYSSETNSALYSRDGKQFVVASNDRTAKIWDAENLQYKGVIKDSAEVVSAQYSFDGKYIFTASANSPIKIWSAKSFKQIGEFNEIIAQIQVVRYSPDGKSMITLSKDGKAVIWDAETRKLKKIIEELDKCKKITVASFSPNGRFIVTAGYDYVKLWNTETYKEARTFDLTKDMSWIIDVQFSPDNKELIGIPVVGKAIIWDVETKEVKHSFSVESNLGQSQVIQYRPDGKYFISVSKQRVVKVWDASTYEPVALLQNAKNEMVVSAQYDPAGEKILIASKEGEITVWSSFSDYRSIQNYPGLDVLNLDLRNLNENSKMNDELKCRLKEFGALIN